MECGAVLLVAAATTAGGCAAGTHATDPVPVPEDRAQEIAAAKAEAAKEASEDARELERRLLLRDEGKLLVLAFRAHGGWDHWLVFSGVAYTRVRSEVSKTAAGSPAPASSSDSPAPDAEPRVSREKLQIERSNVMPLSTSGPEVLDLDDERVVLNLPFLLADEGLRKEYVGVELDLRTGESLEKLRVLREGSRADTWFVVSFDRSSSVVRRILWKRADGSLILTLFSDWREVGGIQVAARRDSYFLRGPFDHWDASRPDRTDRLEDLSPMDSVPSPGGS
jgi:hypothetical protein